MSKAYALAGALYTRYDVEADAADPGYPRAIADGWNGTAAAGFGQSIDAVLDLGTGKAYFFKGAQYVRVDQTSNSVDPGYPLAIGDHWPGLAAAGFASDLDAAANWGDGFAYFFRGDQILRYDITADGAAAGYPRPIRDEFPSLAGVGFDAGLDAVVRWPSGNAYFFRGDSYVRLEAGGAVGDVRPIAGNWPGLTGPLDALWVKLTSAGQGPAPGRLGPGDHVWYWNGNLSTAQDIPRSVWFPGSNPAVPTDYLGHGGEIHNYVLFDAGEIRRGQPHMRNRPGTFAWLNKNPGNITGGIGGPNLGQYPGKANWHNFMIFPTEEAGFDAIGRLLRGAGYRDRTILDAFRRYAPASDGNDPDQYAADVAAAIGLPTSTFVRDLDDGQLRTMQEKIRQIEGAVAGDTLSPASPDLPEAIRVLL